MVHVRNLQARLTETDKRHELAILQASQLQRTLEKEKNASQTLAQQVEKLQEDVEKGQRERKQLRSQEQQQQKLLRELDENCGILERRRMEEVAELRSSVRENESLAAGHLRELELLRKNLTQSEGQVQHLQELLVKKHEKWQRGKERTKPLDSKDIQEMVASQLREEHNKMAATREQLEIRLSEQQIAYQKLEDEFRMALGMEASRYNELERAHQEVCGEIEATRQTAVAAVQKEQRATVIVGELTTLVKDLKLRVKDLSRTKLEMASGLRARVSELDTQVADRNKMEVKLLSAQEVCVWCVCAIVTR